MNTQISNNALLNNAAESCVCCVCCMCAMCDYTSPGGSVPRW